MRRSGLVRQASACIAMLAIVTVVLGFGYPLAVTGISQLFFRHQANGSLVYVDGKLKGSALLGQNFTDANGAPLPQYFQPRPSDAGAPATTGPTRALPTSARPIRCWSSW